MKNIWANSSKATLGEAKLRLLHLDSKPGTIGFVRRHPVFVLGCAFYLGFTWGRFLQWRSLSESHCESGVRMPFRQIISLGAALAPIFLSRASSSEG